MLGTGPEREPGAAFLEEGVPTLNPGDSPTPAYEVRDAKGQVTETPPEALSWVSLPPEVVDVARPGHLRAGEQLGQGIVTLRMPGDGRADTLRVWVQPPPSVPAAFHIELQSQDGIPAQWRQALSAAALRWEGVIRGAPEAVDLDTLGDDYLRKRAACGLGFAAPQLPLHGTWTTLIQVTAGDGETESTIPAVGGPCLQRGLPHPTTIIGSVALNGRKMNEPRTDQDLRFSSLHEMGHALGLVAVVQHQPPTWLRSGRAAATHRGPMALEGFRRWTGVRVDSLDVTWDFHWPYPGDVMSDVDPSTRITPLTVGALMDLGYAAAWYGGG